MGFIVPSGCIKADMGSQVASAIAVPQGQKFPSSFILVASNTCSRSVKRIPNLFVTTYLSLLTDFRGLQALEAVVLHGHPLLPLRVSFRPRLWAYWVLPEVHISPTEGSSTGGHREYQVAPYLLCSQIVGGSYYPRLPQCHHPAPLTRLGIRGGGSVLESHLYVTTPPAGHLSTLAYVNRLCPFETHR